MDRNLVGVVILVLMGVSGAGKTTVGRLLADRLRWPFYEGDEFHSAESIRQMMAGIPLTDTDRDPWLERVAHLVHNLTRVGQSAIITCSALKARYRRRLVAASTIASAVRFVYLKVTPDQALERVERRQDHFLPPSIVASQFAALEEPADALVLEGTWPPEAILTAIQETLQR